MKCVVKSSALIDVQVNCVLFKDAVSGLDNSVGDRQINDYGALMEWCW